MRHGLRLAGPRLAAVLAPLFLFSAAGAFATELALVPVTLGGDDIARVVMRADGGIATQHADAIDLFQRDGGRTSIARAEEGEVLHLSDGGSFVGVALHWEAGEDFAPTETFELRGANGRVLWKTGRTEDVTYVISKDGDVVGMTLNINVPERNKLHFYGAMGATVAEVLVPYLEVGRFDPSGRVLLAVSARDGLHAFDQTGVEAWSIQDVRLFAATDGARAVAVLGAGSLRIVRDGAVAATIPLDDLLVRRIAIAPDGSRIALAGKHEIRVYDGRTLAPLWTARTERDDLSWTSVDVAAANGWLMAGVARDLGPSVDTDRRHPDGEIRAYDAAGALAHRAALTFPIWNIWSPTVLIDRSGKGATVTTRRAVYRTVLP